MSLSPLPRAQGQSAPESRLGMKKEGTRHRTLEGSPPTLVSRCPMNERFFPKSQLSRDPSSQKSVQWGFWPDTANGGIGEGPGGSDLNLSTWPELPWT